jgi:hypothetical protein
MRREAFLGSREGGSMLGHEVAAPLRNGAIFSGDGLEPIVGWKCRGEGSSLLAAGPQRRLAFFRSACLRPQWTVMEQPHSRIVYTCHTHALAV